MFQGKYTPGLYDLYDLYDPYGIAHVAGWEPHNLYDLLIGHFSWVRVYTAQTLHSNSWWQDRI